MATNGIEFNKKDHVGYIIFHQPENGKYANSSLAVEIVDICNRINGDEDIYVALLTMMGEANCSGKADQRAADMEFPQQNPIEAIASLNCPVVAAIKGDAVGEGLELALACDLRIASDRAKFGLPQISDGKIPANGGTQRLSRIAGKGKALEMVLTGEIIEAAEAFEAGLINKVVSHDKLETEAEILVKTLAAKAPFALRYCKEAINKGLDVTLEQGLRLEADLYFLLHTTADRTEGIQAFTQKRPPQFKGR
jgi:enoyl-CoA hydratase/carnithine racemase